MKPKSSPLIAALAVGAVAVTAAAIVYLRRAEPAPRAGDATGPYWRRTGFLSRTLVERQTGAVKGLPSIQVPPGLEVAVAAPSGTVVYPMFISFDDRGRLFVCESAGRNISDEDMEKQHEMRIRLLEDTNGDGVFDRSRIFADRISMTMGAQWYRGALYVAAPPDILRFEDRNGDGVADRREVVLTGWPLHSNGTTLHGPYLGPDGWMYLTYNLGKYNIKTREGTTLTGPGGRVFRFRPDGSKLEWIIGGGYDNGIEIVFTSAGETIGTMTYYRNPKMGERDALLHYVEGGVYPKVTPIVHKYKRTGPLMPALTKFARVAPAGLLRYRGSGLGGDYHGNLFSAHFNPHRILRHTLERDGATFRTKDEDFLVSSDPDFHPTDVAEDADGSLLVVETGAWYLHSCPVSRIAKPEFKGAIYRVRRKGAAPVDDPWGTKLNLASKAPPELVNYLSDPRPAVRDNARELLVKAGGPAVQPLAHLRETHVSPEVRAAAVFALGRIGSAEALNAVRKALSDSQFEVQTAAARMAGLHRDGLAANRLMQMAVSGHPAARRQAATALGQIGDARAVPALLRAAANPRDRFLEHAIIHSLIVLNSPAATLDGISHANGGVRKASLIALDQMDSAAFRREHLAAALQDRDADIQKTALWIASRHPEWAGEVLNVLDARLRGREMSEDEAAAFQEPLLSFCQNPGAQKLIGNALDRSDGRRRAILFETIEQCPVQELPAVWVESFRKHLRAEDPGVRDRVLRLVRSRQVASLDPELQRIASDASEKPDLRVLALGVLAARKAALPESSYQFLSGLLRPGGDADLRQSAAQVLGRARWNESQLLLLSREQLPHADPLVLPYLLDAYESSRSGEVGKTMVAGLMLSKWSGDGIAAARIPALLKQYPVGVHAAARPLLSRIEKEKLSREAKLEELEPLLRQGDPDRGRQVFFGPKAGCASCHTIMAEGGDVGPDLTGIGAVRSGFDLLEAIVFPSASFVPGHEVYRVETDTEVYTGVRGEASGDAVVIVSGPRERVRIPRKQIRSMRPSSVSLMPDGFANDLTREELANLLAFLQAQRSRIETAGR